MERENDADHGVMAEPSGAAVAGMLAGMLALIGWAFLGALGFEAMVIPPLAGGLVGWGAWRLCQAENMPRIEPHSTLHVRRLPPDLPREFS